MTENNDDSEQKLEDKWQRTIQLIANKKRIGVTQIIDYKP